MTTTQTINITTETYYATYGYDPIGYWPSLAEGHLWAVDLIAKNDDGIDQVWSCGDFTTEAEAVAAAEAHAGRSLDWTALNAGDGFTARAAA